MPGKVRTLVVKGPEFPVTVEHAAVWYQVRDFDGKGWRDICTLSADAAKHTIAHLATLAHKPKQGRDYRFIARK